MLDELRTYQKNRMAQGHSNPDSHVNSVDKSADKSAEKKICKVDGCKRKIAQWQFVSSTKVKLASRFPAPICWPPKRDVMVVAASAIWRKLTVVFLFLFFFVAVLSCPFGAEFCAPLSTVLTTAELRFAFLFALFWANVFLRLRFCFSSSSACQGPNSR